MAAIESKFETARLKKNNPDAHDLLSTYEQAGILGLVYDWYTETDQRLERIKSTSAKVANDEELEQSIVEDSVTLERFMDAMNKKDYEIIEPDVRKWLKSKDITFNVDRLSIKTVNIQLMLLTASMNYAAKQDDWIMKNPARDLFLPEPKKNKDKRDPFSIEQLNTLFQAPLYTGCVDDERNYNKPGNKHPRRARFWIALICLYSGLRLNEACQLEIADIEHIRDWI